MTISYQLDVSRASVVCFVRLLFRWRASLWKNVLRELFLWSIAYFIITFFYRSPFIMSEPQKVTFEEIAHYLDTHLTFIPLTFILGFYVSTIIARWTVVFQNMGYIESQALFVSSYVQGDDEETRLQRRAMVRYMCLSQALVFRDICVPVRKRFPTYDSLVKAGFMLEHEKEKLLGYKLDYDKYWVPINWAYSLFFEARKAGKITSDVMTNKMCDELKVFRTNLQMLCNYDWVPLPLVYPQVIMIAVYFYFFVCLFSRQYILTDRETALNKSNIDLVVPIMTMIQFVFYVGWMKAAEVLINPMGEDDDDFECNYLLDKNLATSLCIVDECRADVPPIEMDQFWESGQVEQIYTEATAATHQHPLIGSAVHAKLHTKTKDGSTSEMIVRQPPLEELQPPATADISLRHRSVQIQNEKPDLSKRRQTAAPILHQTAAVGTSTDDIDTIGYGFRGVYDKNRSRASLAVFSGLDRSSGRSAAENISRLSSEAAKWRRRHSTSFFEVSKNFSEESSSCPESSGAYFEMQDSVFEEPPETQNVPTVTVQQSSKLLRRQDSVNSDEALL